MEKKLKKSYAKINLTLDVLGKRTDGYHDLEMVMQTINLYDELEFTRNDTNEIKIISNCDKLQNENIKSNIIYKVIEKTFEYCNYEGNKGIEIKLNKKIPLEAGLAGGSSNGAETIKAVNELYGFNLTLEQMIEIGKSVGADIPFCLVGGTAKVTGIGEIVEPIKKHKKTNILIIKPNVSVSTKYIFENLKISEVEIRPDTKKMIEAIEKEDINLIAKNLCNVLEVVTIKKYDIIREIKEFMLTNKAIGSIMTGSGSCVFGYFENINDLQDCTKKMKNNFKDLLIFETTTL